MNCRITVFSNETARCYSDYSEDDGLYDSSDYSFEAAVSDNC